MYTFYIKPLQHNKVLNGDPAAERCQNMQKMCEVEPARKVWDEIQEETVHKLSSIEVPMPLL